MLVLGIDPGSINTGYGVVEKGRGGRVTRVTDGVIKPVKGATLADRLAFISDGLNAVIRAYPLDAVAVEAVFFAKNVKSAVTLGHARGVALASAANAGLRVFEYSPRTIKLSVTGYGNAAKADMQKMIRLILKIDGPIPPDAADALSAALCHINTFNATIDRLTK